MKYKNIREEELKNKVGADWFKQFDTTEILGNIDFTVLPKQGSLFGRIPLPLLYLPLYDLSWWFRKGICNF